MTTFANIDQAAHSGANGHNSLPEATLKQRIAGNYLKGRLTLHGLHIAIESPRGTLRHWQAEDGTSGTNLMKFHYGYIEGTRGNDGDELDCSIGPAPEATRAYVINQFIKGKFDEHKIMLAFPDKRTAMAGYLSNYEPGWQGLDSCIPCSITQLKWWIANGNMARPLTQDQLPFEGTDMDKVIWDGANNPLRSTLDQVLYNLRAHDANEGLLFDSLSMADILADSDGVLTFDALVIPLARLEQRMAILQKVIDRAGDAVKVAAMQVSDPFTQAGSTNVAVIYELTDGQTVSVFFHNPDVTPKKIMANDDLISWKWMLNKKDITVAVAPERGRDLDVRTVAARIMRLAEANSARFIAANGKRAEKLQVIAGLKDELATKEGELNGLLHQIEVATVERETAYGNAVRATSATQDAYVRASDNGGTDPKTGKTKDELGAEIDGQVAGIKDMQNALNGKDAFSPEAAPEPVAAVAGPNVDSIKAVVTSDNPMPGVNVPADWIVMNAPRPLLGQETLSNGEFLSGRWYAALDPQDYMTQAYIDNNVKMDASVVFVADKATLTAMALQTIGRYQATYLKMDEEHQATAISPFITKLNGKTYGELKALAALGMPVIAAPAPVVEVAPIIEPVAAVVPQDAPVVEPAAAPTVPDAVKRTVESALIRLREIKQGIDDAVGLEQKFGSPGRYQADAYLNRKSEIESAQASLAEFRKHAPGNGIDAEAYIVSLGGEPDMTPSPEAQAWMTKPEPAAPAAEPVADPVVEPVAADLTYRAVDDMFTSFYPNTAAGEEAWKIIAAQSEGTGKVLNNHVESTIQQLRDAGYTVAEAAPADVGDDDLLAELTAPDPVAAVAAQQDAEMKDEDISFLRSIIDGTHDLSDPGVPGDLGLMHKERSGDAEFMALFKQAVKAYSAYAVAKANAALTK